MDTIKIAVIPGDGIGTEVMPEGLRVLEAAGALHDIEYSWTNFDWSCEHYARTGAMMPADGIEQLREMNANWPFFRNLLADTEMVLAKADMRIAARYAQLADDLGAQMFPVLEQQFQKTGELICNIKGCTELLENDPELQHTLRLRAPYVDPMSLMQVDLLARWRATGREDQELELALTETVRGITRGMQNAG